MRLYEKILYCYYTIPLDFECSYFLFIIQKMEYFGFYILCHIVFECVSALINNDGDETFWKYLEVLIRISLYSVLFVFSSGT